MIRILTDNTSKLQFLLNFALQKRKHSMKIRFDHHDLLVWKPVYKLHMQTRIQQKRFQGFAAVGAPEL
jgi:hypothetical protein